jgi:hypothetical protein
VNNGVPESLRYAFRESVGWCRSIGPLILNLGFSWGIGHQRAPVALPPERKLMLPTEYEAHWAPDAVWMLSGAEKYWFSRPEWMHDSSLVTLPTELFLHVVGRNHDPEDCQTCQ